MIIKTSTVFYNEYLPKPGYSEHHPQYDIAFLRKAIYKFTVTRPFVHFKVLLFHYLQPGDRFMTRIVVCLNIVYYCITEFINS